MQFIVPQFIDRKAKVIGALTFKQFVFVGIAGAFCIFLYFLIPWKNTAIVICVFILGAGVALAFIKIGKDPLPVVIRNLFFYLLGPKVYLWKKDFLSHKTFNEPKITAEIKEETPMGVSKESQLKKLSTYIDTKLR